MKGNPMPILIPYVRSAVDADAAAVVETALKKLTSSEIKTAKIYKTSLDARKRRNIHMVHTVYVELFSDDEEKSLCRTDATLKYVDKVSFSPTISKTERDGRVVIAGFGPAGMFCGLALAEQGYKPLILERGDCVENRTKIIRTYWDGGELDENTNVQFGEGGAGTFSDGKLTTRIKDPLCRYVLKRFVEFGAPEEILYKAKPHIGTDNLRKIVKNIRERIISCGGEIRFLSRLEDLQLENRYVSQVSAGGTSVETSALVLAVGHSARDTFELLFNKGVALAPKPFAVGARIEHLQSEVDESLYGEFAGSRFLPKGEYQLSARDKNGRGCYTFCMCPGGYVVPAASEQGGIVTNGMSEYLRDGSNANAAVVVSVTPDDFGKTPLEGVMFARSIERNAFLKTGGKTAPAATVGELLGSRNTSPSVIPTYSRGVSFCGIDGVLPATLLDTMRDGIKDFGRKMRCFRNMGAVLTFPETRTSSPVRILRSDRGNSVSADNLYPCGEGSGYSGGITSSAVDGLKTAMHIMESFAP